MSAADGTASGVTYAVGDHVATITFDRPDKLNAITPDMLAGYVAALRRADDDVAVRCVVVTGRGRAFCAGADVSLLASGVDDVDDVAGLADADRLPSVARDIGTPVVMAVNGPCVGLGFAIAVTGDIRVAGESTTMGALFPRLGLVAEYGLAWLLPRVVGGGPAADLLLTGRTVDAAEALRLGLVTAVHDDDELLAAATRLARDIADGCAPWAVRTIKAQLREAATTDWDTAMSHALGLMHASFRRPEIAEAMRARAEKRPPAFPD